MISNQLIKFQCSTFLIYFLLLKILNFQASAGNAENVKDELNGLDKAVSAVLGQRTIERNRLLVKIAKGKFTKQKGDKGEKTTKPEELVRLYDLLLQVNSVKIYIFKMNNSLMSPHYIELFTNFSYAASLFRI